MLILLIKTIIIYFLLIFSIRLMGKRQLGELQASEFVIAIMLSEIAVAPITSDNFPLSHAILSVLTLITLEFVVTYLLIQSNLLKRLFYGRPAILVNKGNIDMDTMKKNRIELDELLCELRQKGYSDPSHIDYVILEKNGKLSVFPKPDKTPITPGDLQLTVRNDGIAHVIILDGTILKHNLTLINWNLSRLEHELARRHATSDQVFLLTVDDGGHITFILKKNK